MSQPKESLSETLASLVRIPSYSEQEIAVQQHIANWFTERDLQPFAQGENLVLHLKGADSTRALIFNSHVDVVDAGDESKWEYGPWSGHIKDDRIYGRGTSDMKSGAAVSMELAARMNERVDLPYDLWFTYVVREETDGKGTQSFAQWFEDQGYTDQYQEVAVVFTEPTDLDKAQFGHRGNFFVKAEIDGDAGHASQPNLIKRHAIMELVGFIDDLQKESASWGDSLTEEGFLPPTITPTSIEAKSGSANKTADHAQAIFDLRTIPKFHEEAYETIRRIAETRGIKISLAHDGSPVGYTDPDSKLILALKNIVPNLTLEVSQASADLGFMTSLGVQGVIYGPGEKSQMHEINESAPLEHLEKAVDIFSRLIDEWR